MSAIGGYVRRKDRKYSPPVKPDPRRCSMCHARYDQGPFAMTHICKELTYGTPVLGVVPFEVKDA
jgi:hypothetical protein